MCMGSYQDVVNLALRRGLFFPAGEIYSGALRGFYDFGPYGAALKRKIVNVWRNELIKKEDMFEINGALILPEPVFKSSGHLANFSDPVTTCGKCGIVHRADQLLDGEFKESTPVEELTKGLRNNKIVCPSCGSTQLSDVKKFNMMVRAEVGLSGKSVCYLRPESCQSIFLAFSRLMKTMRLKLPKGVAQYGKVFRNEISPRQSLLRQVEFDQMEVELFFDVEAIDSVENFSDVAEYALMVQLVDEDVPKPRKVKELVEKKIFSGKVIAYYLARTQQLFEKYGLPKERMRFRQLGSEERAFYAREAWDFEVQTSLGWLELAANNYRTEYDLQGHMKGSGTDLQYVTPEGKKFIPHVWEISIGTDRVFYAVLENALRKEGEREWLSLPASLTPIEVGVFPLLKNKPELVEFGKKVANLLRQDNIDVLYDDAGSIGKRYARVDEVGCPFCVAIDFTSLEDNTVTIRERDSSQQVRVKLGELANVLRKLLWEELEFSKAGKLVG